MGACRSPRRRAPIHPALPRPSSEAILRRGIFSWRGGVSSGDVIARVHKASRGLPRAVNNLAVQALIAAFAAGAYIVEDKAAWAAVVEASSE